MSQHIYNTTTPDGKPVQVKIGWDRTLRQYFYDVMDLSPEAEDPVIATSMCLPPSSLPDLDRIAEDLKNLGITVPEKLLEEVQADEVNNVGNRIERY